MPTGLNPKVVAAIHTLPPLNNHALELRAHMANVTELKQQLSLRHPDVNFQAWFVAPDASGRFTEWRNLIPEPIIG